MKNLAFIGGNPNNPSHIDYGGAINNEADNLKVIGCNFTKNTARYGGAIYSTWANVSIIGCGFTSNTVDYSGAAIELDGDDNYVSDCMFVFNVGGHAGGDVAWIGSNGILENSRFISHGDASKATQFGGAVVWMGANGRISTSTFDSYKSKKYGSAVYWKGANGTLEYSIFCNIENTYWGNPDYAKNNYWGFNINSSDEFAAKKLIYFDGNYVSAPRWVNIDVTDTYINFTSNDGSRLDDVFPDYKYDSGVEIINNTYKVKIQTAIACSNLVTYCLYGGKSLKVTLTSNGVKLPLKYVYVNINGKTLSAKTNAQGVAYVKISLKNSGTYPASVSFKGEGDYKDSLKKVKVTVKKQKPTLTIQTKTLTAKSKTVNVVLKDQFKKAIGKTAVKITVNKKTYSAKTISKGVATFKVNLKVKKVYKVTAKFSGNKYYDNVSKSASIKLK